MPNISNLLGFFFQKENYHNINQDSNKSDSKNISKLTLDGWKKLYPSNVQAIGGILKTYEFAQKVLNDLCNENIPTKENAETIGCHLWALAKTSEINTGRDTMFDFFFENIPKEMGEEKKEIAAQICCAMIGSGKRGQKSQR